MFLRGLQLVSATAANTPTGSAYATVSVPATSKYALWLIMILVSPGSFKYRFLCTFVYCVISVHVPFLHV
jgi:hypothetical protein